MAPMYLPPPPLLEPPVDEDEEAEEVEALELLVLFLVVLAFLLGDFLVLVDFLVELLMVLRLGKERGTEESGRSRDERYEYECAEVQRETASEHERERAV